MRGDVKLSRMLDALGIVPHALLGQGGESWVFALDDQRVARINRPGASRAQVDSRITLLAELAPSSEKVPFAIPTVLNTLEIDGYIITIERRLPGRPLIDILADAAGESRVSLIHAYLETASQIGDLAISRPWYGDLLSGDAIRTSSYHAYLQQRAARSLQAAGPDFQDVDPMALAAALPEPERKSLVHLDAFPGNMLSDGKRITAVLDFGAPSLIGDRRLDPITAAVYLDPAMTATANVRDRAVAQEWLVERELDGCFKAVQNWIAAYWSFAMDDIKLYQWCREILHT